MSPARAASQLQLSNAPVVDIREAMAAVGTGLPRPLWRLLQSFFTWLSAKPYRGQKPLLRMRPMLHLVANLLQLTLGVALGVIAYHFGGWCYLLLWPGWVLVVGSHRKFFLVIMHAAIHNDFFRSKWLNNVLTQMVSLVIFTVPNPEFVAEHSRRHHGKTFCTLRDPDVRTLYACGIRPGLSKRQLRWNLARSLLTPWFYLWQVWLRFKVNVIMPHLSRRILSVAYLVGTAALVTYFDVWGYYLVAWAVPTFIGFHVAALLGFAGEHFWYSTWDPEKSDRRTWQQEQTHARFSGSLPPQRSPWTPIGALSWLGWWTSLLCWSLPLRIAIVPGDMPVHDHHHIFVKADWSNGFFERQKKVEEGVAYREIWGVFNAINLVFDKLESLSPITPEQAREAELTTA